jgi:hypothetical protein
MPQPFVRSRRKRNGRSVERLRVLRNPDAHKAWRQHMQQKAPQELSHVQGHQTLFIFVRRVAPAKGHLIVGERNEPVVRDSDSMRVAAEIAEGMFGAAKWPLRIDDPLLAKKLAV